MKQTLIVLALAAALAGILCLTGCGKAKYKIDFQGQEGSFSGAKEAYAAGEKVSLRMNLIAMDEGYTFYVDGEVFQPTYDGEAYVLEFTMPDHDTVVRFETAGSMTHVVSVDKKVTDFTYSYNNPFGACGYTYELKDEEGDRVTFAYQSDLYPDDGTMETRINSIILTQVSMLISEDGAEDWDGFAGSNPDVSDGDGFYLHVTFEDGTSLTAYGENSCPEGYGVFKTDIDELFSPFVETVLEEKRQEVMDKGINGELNYVYVNLVGRGEAGKDEYFFTFYKNEEEAQNFSVRIRSVSGDFLPAGNYRAYTHLDNDRLPFGEVQALIEKYDLISWYNYDKIAEDYENKEYFQMSFGFDDDLSLQASGSEPPENYQAFRQEFLTLMAKLVNDNPEAFAQD